MTGSLDKRSTSAEQTEQLGEALAAALQPGDVIALRGELGAGKTRFVAGLARGLASDSRVRSPSFTLVHTHEARVRLHHLDLYRLASAQETDGLGLEELRETGALVVEWGERLPAPLLAEALMLAARVIDADTREWSASAWGGRGKSLLEAWRSLPEPQ